MKFRQIGRHDEDKMQLRMTPMIDVVFLLLIFFMCVSKWKLAEGNLAAELPSEGAQSTVKVPLDLEKIIIKLKRSDDGVYIKLNNDRLCPTFQALYQQLKALRQIEDLPVIIDADRDVLFRDAILALNTSVKADLSNVSFAAPLSRAPGG